MEERDLVEDHGHIDGSKGSALHTAVLIACRALGESSVFQIWKWRNPPADQQGINYEAEATQSEVRVRANVFSIAT